jgi:hypothetical protein
MSCFEGKKQLFITVQNNLDNTCYTILNSATNVGEFYPQYQADKTYAGSKAFLHSESNPLLFGL